MTEEKTIDYILDQLKNIMAIDSPSGYGQAVTDYLLKQFEEMGVSATRTVKGGVVCKLEGKEKDNAILLQAHCDTLGAMVHEIKANGRLRLTPIGGLSPVNTETENVRVRTRDGKVYEGTYQLENASVHVNNNFGKAERTWDSMEVVLDEDVKDKEGVEKLGISNGDYVCFETRTRITESGYIKSRFLDDKLSASILLGLAKSVVEEKWEPARPIYMHFTIYEEVGHGGSNPCYPDVKEAWSVDMGCVGEGLNCTERQVSIAAKDSGGPYHYETVSKLIRLAKENGIDYAVDIYPYYGSDVEATLVAGNDIRHALIGPGVYASHGYERSHREGVRNTYRLLRCYLDQKNQ